MPSQLQRQGRDIALGAATVLLLVTGTAVVLLGVDPELLFGGWHWAALAFAACEAVLAVFGAVWILGFAQRFDRRYRWTERLASTAYPAFVVQTPVLLGAAVALRPLGAPAEVKALLVAAVSVPAAFLLGDLMRRGARQLSGNS